MRRLLIVALLSLAACDRPSADAGLNVDQAAALDNDAELQDASPDGLTAPAEGNVGNVAELDN